MIEECSEVAQACTKIIRFGIDNYHPDTHETNVASLSTELGELFAMVHVLRKAGIALSEQHMKEAAMLKLIKLKKWSGIPHAWLEIN